MNYSIFSDLQRLHGNRVLDPLMRFSAQYLLIAVFAVLGLLLLARLRADGLRVAVRDALWPGAALVLSYVLGLVAAALHPEARPFTTHSGVRPLIDHHPGQAFPSDTAPPPSRSPSWSWSSCPGGGVRPCSPRQPSSASRASTSACTTPATSSGP